MGCRHFLREYVSLCLLFLLTVLTPAGATPTGITYDSAFAFRTVCTSLTAVAERMEKWDNSRFVYHDLDMYELPFGPSCDDDCESDEGWNMPNAYNAAKRHSDIARPLPPYHFGAYVMIIVAMIGLISYCLDVYMRSVKQLILHAADMSATPTLTPTAIDRAATTAHGRDSPTLYDYFELDELRLLLGLVPPQLSLCLGPPRATGWRTGSATSTT